MLYNWRYILYIQDIKKLCLLFMLQLHTYIHIPYICLSIICMLHVPVLVFINIEKKFFIVSISEKSCVRELIPSKVSLESDGTLPIQGMVVKLQAICSRTIIFFTFCCIFPSWDEWFYNTYPPAIISFFMTKPQVQQHWTKHPKKWSKWIICFYNHYFSYILKWKEIDWHRSFIN